MLPIVCIIGNSGSGKTFLIVKLISELKRRGYRIGTIKHAHHGFDMDKKGKDSWLHQAAGAEIVMVSSPKRVAMIREVSFEGIDSLKGYFNEMDLILAEGFKHDSHPKIQVYRSEIKEGPIRNVQGLIGFVSDSELDLGVPGFSLDDIKGIADLIENKYLSPK